MTLLGLIQDLTSQRKEPSMPFGIWTDDDDDDEMGPVAGCGEADRRKDNLRQYGAEEPDPNVVWRIDQREREEDDRRRRGISY